MRAHARWASARSPLPQFLILQASKRSRNLTKEDEKKNENRDGGKEEEKEGQSEGPRAVRLRNEFASLWVRAALPGGLPHVRLQARSRRSSRRMQSVKCTCRSRTEDAPAVMNLKKQSRGGRGRKGDGEGERSEADTMALPATALLFTDCSLIRSRISRAIAIIRSSRSFRGVGDGVHVIRTSAREPTIAPDGDVAVPCQPEKSRSALQCPSPSLHLHSRRSASNPP